MSWKDIIKAKNEKEAQLERIIRSKFEGLSKEEFEKYTKEDINENSFMSPSATIGPLFAYHSSLYRGMGENEAYFMLSGVSEEDEGGFVVDFSGPTTKVKDIYFALIPEDDDDYNFSPERRNIERRNFY